MPRFGRVACAYPYRCDTKKKKQGDGSTHPLRLRHPRSPRAAGLPLLCQSSLCLSRPLHSPPLPWVAGSPTSDRLAGWASRAVAVARRHGRGEDGGVVAPARVGTPLGRPRAGAAGAVHHQPGIHGHLHQRAPRRRRLPRHAPLPPRVPRLHPDLRRSLHQRRYALRGLAPLHARRRLRWPAMGSRSRRRRGPRLPDGGLLLPPRPPPRGSQGERVRDPRPRLPLSRRRRLLERCGQFTRLGGCHESCESVGIIQWGCCCSIRSC